MNIKSFIHRHQPAVPSIIWIKAGLGAALGMGFIGWLGDLTGEPLLIAPFGATCVLLFAVPNSPLAQPANVIGGHMLAAAVTLLLRHYLPADWWAIGLAVGLVIALMVAFKVTHPPAGATPVVVMLSDPGPLFLLFPMLTSSIVLVLFAWLVHRLPPHTAYPMAPEIEGEGV